MFSTQTLYQKIRSLFSTVKALPKAAETKGTVAEATVPYVVTQANLKTFTEVIIHFPNSVEKTPQWKSRSPVVVTTQFGGWGYVEGRRKEFRVNNRLSVVEADNDLEFSEACILIDGTPCAIIGWYAGRGLTITVITQDHDYVAEILSPSGYDCSTVEAVQALPAGVHRVFSAVMQSCLSAVAQLKAETPDPVEKILDYSYHENEC